MKNNTILLLFIGFLLSQVINGQISFQKNYGLATIGDYGNSVVQTSDNGYFIAGVKVTSNGSIVTGEASIKRTDMFGNELWTNYYSTPNSGDLEFKSIEKTTDNNLIIAGSVNYSFSGNYTNMYLTKIDLQGNTIWSKNYGGQFRQSANQVKETLDGGFVIGGWNEINGGAISSFQIIKTNNFGDEVWTKNYPNGMQQYAKSIIQNTDGGFAIAGSIVLPTSIGEYFYVIKTNELGEEIWTKIITEFSNGSATEVKSKPNGNLIISGYSTQNGFSQPILFELDLNGNIVWYKIYENNSWGWAMSFCKTNDDGYAVFGLDTDSKCFLIKTDSIGNQDWIKRFDERTYNYGYNVRQTTDAGFIMTGITSDDNIPNVLLIKTDGTGNILEINSPITNKSTLSIYPNPSNGVFKVKLNKENIHSTIEIFNTIGQLIHSQKIIYSDEIIDLSKYSNGFYYIKVGNVTTKVIKI